MRRLCFGTIDLQLVANGIAVLERYSDKAEDVRQGRPLLATLFIADTAREFDLQIGTFGHMGDGNLHPTFLSD